MQRLTFLWLVCALPGTAAASAATYSFTNIIDSTAAAPTGNYLNIGDAAISGNRVAFKAGYNQGFLGVINSIFSSTGGPRTEIVQELTNAPPGGNFTNVGRPSINGDIVTFSGHYSSLFVVDGDGVFWGNGGALNDYPLSLNTTQSHPPNLEGFYYAISNPLVTSTGNFVFLGSSTSTVSDSIYCFGNCGYSRLAGEGDPAPSGGTFSGIDSTYAASGDTVAFRGLYGSSEGIFTKTGVGPLTTIVKKGNAAPPGGTFTSVAAPAVSGEKVAFRGSFTVGSGIFTGSGGSLSTIVRTGDTTPGGKAFTSFSVPAISENLVAFGGNYAGGSGIYAKSGDEFSKVIEIGDPIFGSTVASLAFTGLGLDPGDSGNVAFTYRLADGRSGVAMAYAGPAPPAVYQWEYVNAADPGQGRRQSATPVPDSAGMIAVPVLVFANRNFTMAHLVGADLLGADARNTNFTDADLSSADLTNAKLSGADLSGAELESARLNGAKFDGAEVRGANFRRSSVIVPCAPGALFCTPQVKSSGGITPAQLTTTASYNAHDLSGINFEGNDLTNAKLANQNLAGAHLTGALLTGANLAGADIRGASFGRYTLTSGCDRKPAYDSCRTVTNTFGTGIALAQLTASASYLAHDLTGVDFGGNNLAGGNFAEQNLKNVSFLGANLTNADLRNANVTKANFRSATLTGANLSGADARGSLFTDAVLTGAVLTNFIQSDGRVSGLDLGAGQMLLVRDYDGDPASTPTPLAPGPIQTLPDLTAIRIYEETFTTSLLSYAPNATELATRLAGPLAVGNRDIGFIDDESYDVFYSDANGELNPQGRYLTIEGVWRRPELRADGGMNINEVELVFGGANPHTQFGDFVASSVIGSSCDPGFGSNCIPGSEARAVDHDLTTFPRFGQTSTTNLDERFRLTIGFGGAGYSGNPNAITVDQHFVMSAGGTLRMMLEADTWDSTISFAAGIPVALGGTLELTFADGTNLASQIGRTFKLFNWDGVSPTGQFTLSSPYRWDLSRLYTAGEVTLTAVPEPSTIATIFVGALCLNFHRRRNPIVKSFLLVPCLLLGFSLPSPAGAEDLYPDFALVVQLPSYEAFLTNFSDAPLRVDGYNILSALGSLRVAGWAPLHAAGTEIVAALGPGADGFLAANPHPTSLAELNPLGSATWQPGQSWSMGFPFNSADPGFVFDPVFKFASPDGLVLTGGTVVPPSQLARAALLAVPEPSSLWLMLIAAPALALVSRKAFGNARWLYTFPLITSLLAADTAQALTITTVPIGIAGNAADGAGGFGSVAYPFRMGETEISNAQYVEFLNAAATSDPYSLYKEPVSPSPFASPACPTCAGITRDGMPGAYTYAVKPPALGQGPGGTDYSYENKPAVYLTRFDAMRFVNWLHNGQGSGDTESGATRSWGALRFRRIGTASTAAPAPAGGSLAKASGTRPPITIRTPASIRLIRLAPAACQTIISPRATPATRPTSAASWELARPAKALTQ